MADIADQAEKAMHAAQKTSDKARENVEGGMQSGSEWAMHVAGAAKNAAKDALSDARTQGEGARAFGTDEARRFADDRSAWTDQAAEMASRVSDATNDEASRAADRAVDLAQELGQLVRDQPLLTLSVAGIVGYMAAFVLHRRR